MISLLLFLCDSYQLSKLKSYNKLTSIKSSSKLNTDSSIITNTILISGTTIGAGMLALPSVAAPIGFIPSSITLFGAWIVMCSTGLLIAEASCNINQSNDTIIGIRSMTKLLLNPEISLISSILFVTNNFILLVAYISQAGQILSNVSNYLTISPFQGTIAYTVGMTGIMLWNRFNAIEVLNNSLFILLSIIFIGLVAIGIPEINIDNLLENPQNYFNIYQVIPIMFLALVYHNIVPSVCLQLNYIKSDIQSAIIYGSIIPLVMFILWNAIILGIGGISGVDGSYDPIEVLKSKEMFINTNDNIINQIYSHISVYLSIFSISAITTSFIGFVIAQVDFFKEILPNIRNNLTYYLLTLIPPLLIATVNPSIFLQALDYAGTYGVSILFGLIPVVIVHKLRTNAEVLTTTGELTVNSNKNYEFFLPGGDSTLLAIAIAVSSVIFLKFINQFIN